MKYVVPDMAQSFGTLEFAGESEPVFERDKNNRRVLSRRSYNPVSYTHLITIQKRFLSRSTMSFTRSTIASSHTMFVELTLNLALGQNSEWRPKRF